MELTGQKDTPTFVLVHGAYHGGWCWDLVVKEMHGSHVYTPTLTGLSERRGEYSRKINLDRHIQDIVGLIEDENLGSVHLVGWSYGGMVITGVLNRIPARIIAITYLDAYLPADGQSAASFNSAGERALLNVVSMFGVGIRPPDPRVWGIDAEHQLSLLDQRLSPQPPRTLTQSVHAPEPWPEHVRYSYVRCRGYSGSIFDQFHSKAEADKRFRVMELQSSHASPMTHPKDVARVLTT